MVSGQQINSSIIEMRVLPDLDNVIDMVAHRDKQIEKQFATNLHLHLHGSAPLESLTTSNDQG
jgi:hypothetical protein